MEKIKQIEKAILEARLKKDDLTKNLLQTLKGEFENALKNGEPSSDQLVEKIAKKMVKGAELVGTDDAKREIEILNAFLPAQLREADIKVIVENVISANPDKLAQFKSGNKGVIGFFMGSVMKESEGSADAKVAGKIVNDVLATK